MLLLLLVTSPLGHGSHKNFGLKLPIASACLSNPQYVHCICIPNVISSRVHHLSFLIIYRPFRYDRQPPSRLSVIVAFTTSYSSHRRSSVPVLNVLFHCYFCGPNSATSHYKKGSSYICFLFCVSPTIGIHRFPYRFSRAYIPFLSVPTTPSCPPSVRYPDFPSLHFPRSLTLSVYTPPILHKFGSVLYKSSPKIVLS